MFAHNTDKHLMRHTILSLLLASATLLPSPSAIAAQDASSELVRSANTFALRAFQLVKRDTPGNLFFTPLALHQGLAMISAGTSDRTATQLATIGLHAPTATLSPKAQQKKSREYHTSYGLLLAPFLAESNRPPLRIYSQLWGQTGLQWLPEFKNTLLNNYASPLQETDFGKGFTQSEQAIRNWTSEKTKGLIVQSPKAKVISRLARLVLTTAACLDAPWAREFNKARTKTVSFNLLSGEKTITPLMHDTPECRYAEDKEMQALAIPYAYGDAEMLIILPRKIEDIETISNNLTLENLSGIIALLKKKEVNVYLPKFQIASAINAKSLLTRMGVANIFSPTADFSNAVASRGLYLSGALQNSVIRLTEKGKEGSGVGAFVARLNQGSTQDIPLFRADHPFLFIVRHVPSGLILATGRLMQPQLVPITNPDTNPNAAPGTVKIQFAHSGKNIQVKKGRTVELSLNGNPTTGYLWQLSALRGDSVRIAGKPKYQRVSTATGSGGTYIFTLNTLKTGSTIMALSYARPWEKGKPPLKVFNITITVLP